MDALRWGLLPHWARELRIGVRGINARGETIREKPMFRDAFARDRCLVPVDGFYEWARGPGGEKTPYNITGAGGAPLMLAGLWARNQRLGSPGRPVDSFTVVTVPPNPLVSRLHDRMPAILPPDAWRTWLDPRGAPETLQALLVPFEGPMTAWPVARKVGNVRLKDDPSVVEPTGPALEA